MTAITDVTTSGVYESTISSIPASTLVVLSFRTAWAAPCTQMDELLAAIASTYPEKTPPSIAFLRIDAEELPDISESFDVTAVPFTVLQRNGKVLESLSGCDAEKVRTTIGRWASKEAEGDTKVKLPAALMTTPREDSDVVPQANGHAPPASNGAHSHAQLAATTSDALLEQKAAAPKETAEELHNRIAELVKAAKVMLFMKGTPSSPQCGFSRQLVGILREYKVRYGFFNILADEDVRQGLKTFADWPTFPQLWMDGDLVGGLDIVKEEIEANPDFFKKFTAEAAKAQPAEVAAES